VLGRIYSAAGRHDEALNETRRALALVRRTGYLAEYARALTASGRAVDAEPILQELAQRGAQGDDYGSSVENLGDIAAAAGRRDEAFRFLDQAIDRRSPNVLWLRVDPRVDPLHSDPRFDALLSRIGLGQ
jgi:predicted Zn-dependent protease